MPEGDTIRRLAERINRRFAGERCERSVTRDPRLVHVDFAGAVLREADARGKHLLIRFDDGRTLFAHLRMDGSFTVGPAATESAWRRRVELWMETGRLTGIDVPVLGVVRTVDEDQVVGHLGPDLCGPELPDLDDVVERIAEHPEAPLAGALLDQRNVAGFGNVYAVELPFVVGVSPQPAGGDRRRAARNPRTGRRGHPHEREAGTAEHDRSQAAGGRPLDLRPARPAVPAVRHPPRRLGRARQPVAAGRHVVPELPARRADPDRRPRAGPAPAGPAPGPPRADLPPGLTLLAGPAAWSFTWRCSRRAHTGAMDIGPGELIVVLVVVLLIFGSTRLPALGKSLGEAMREVRHWSDERA